MKLFKFCILKTSTYNSLKTQLELKDQIISKLSEDILNFRLLCNTQKESIVECQRRIKAFEFSDKAIQDSLEIQIQMRDNELSIARHMQEDLKSKFETLQHKFNTLNQKYTRSSQPRINGKFAPKVKENEEM